MKKTWFLMMLLSLCLFPVSGFAEEQEEQDAWTVLIYMCGSDLESKYSYAVENLKEIAAVNVPVADNNVYVADYFQELEGLKAKSRQNVNVLIETGGAKKWHGSEIGMDIRSDVLQDWEYHPAQVEGETGSFSLENEKPLASMADPDTLSDFIRWGVENYPAEKYGLVLWDHGGGSATGILIDELFDGAYMTLDQLSQALENGGTHLETIVFDACLMANLETACAVDDYANWMVASEELVAGKGTAFGDWLRQLYYVPVADGEMLGRWICDTAYVKYSNLGDKQSLDLLTWSVINLSNIEPVAVWFDKINEVIGKAYAQYPVQVGYLAKSANYLQPFGTGQEHMYDLGCLMYAPTIMRLQNAEALFTQWQTLSNAVAYCVRGSGRSSARGLSFCVAFSFSNEKKDIYARNCPSPHYLALLDFISTWTAPDWVYEEVERYPEISSDELYSVEIEKQIYENGSPAFAVIDGEWNVGAAQYSLAKKDEETGEIIELGKVPVYLDPEKNIYRIYDLTTWPAIDGSLCQIIQQDVITDGVYNILYNIPVMIGSKAMNMRCVYWFDKARFEIQGLWEDYDSDSSQFNRNVQSLSSLSGREFNLLYTLRGSKENGKASYILSEPKTIYPVLDVEITTLPPGTYYLSFSLLDILRREMPIDTVEYTWDGQNFTINSSWEGTQRLSIKR